MAEAPRPKRQYWRFCRRSFRWLRITLLGTVLLILVLLTWLRFAGLPDFIRIRLVRELANRGIAANFSSLRFQWFRGFVAEDLRASWGGGSGPRLTMREVDLDVAPPPWGKGRDLIRGLSVRSGNVVVPLGLTNEPNRQIQVDNISADIRFLTGDAWEIRRFAAEVLGLQLELRATLTNVNLLRRKRASPDSTSEAQSIRIIRAAVEELEAVVAPRRPRLELSFVLDGANPWMAEGDAYLDVPELRSPRGHTRDFKLSVRAQRQASAAEPVETTGIVEIGELQTPSGSFSALKGRLKLSGPARPALPTNAVWSATVGDLAVKGVKARQIQLSGTNSLLARPVDPGAAALAAVPLHSVLSVLADSVEIGLDDKEPLYGTSLHLGLDSHHHPALEIPEVTLFKLSLDSLNGTPGSFGTTLLHGEIRRRLEDPGPPPPEVSYWGILWPVTAHLEAEVSDIRSAKLQLAHFKSRAEWNAPRLALSRMESSLYGGELHAHGGLDILSRRAELNAETTFDLHGIDELLGPRARKNFQRYQWENPPWFLGGAEAILPPWTDKNPDWDGVVKPTVRMHGRFEVGSGSFKGVTFNRATSSLTFDGQNWRLPDMKTERPEGRQDIRVDYNEDTQEYRVDAQGRVMPPVLKPLLGEQSAQVLELIEFNEPVSATVSVWGPWSEGSQQAIMGSVAATNFTFRGQHFDHLITDVHYTNRTLVAAPVYLTSDGGDLRIDGLGYHFDQDRLWLTNAINTIKPATVAAAISPSFGPKIAPYRFDYPPRIVANGTVRPRDTENSADLVFDVEGGPFHFWRLSADQVQTRLLWKGTTLTLTNLHADFYRGRMDGNASFDLRNREHGKYEFDVHVRHASLGDLLSEATPGRTNVAQGTFNLDLEIVDADTSDIHTWNGYGRAAVQDGLLWDVPIFGFLSPVLNGFVPGIGNNRAERAAASFTITNSVIHTRDLVIACPPARLLYRGTLDFDQRVNAKVEGQVLSDIGGVGPLFGLLLRPLTKLMEFRVTGTLAHVEAEPLYIPKFLLLPLQPVKVLKDIFGGDHKTNAPALKE